MTLHHRLLNAPLAGLCRVACVAALTATLALALPSPAGAQAWPAKPIRMVVTFPPGGSSDIVARLIAPVVGEQLGQPVIVENKPGAGATIGASEVARAAPDGYTFMLSNTAPISLSPFMLEKPPYDPIKSFTHVAYIGSVANVFVVHPDVPARTVPELVAWAKKTGQVNYGSGGVGSIGHIVGEIFRGAAKIDLQHVGYKGSAPMHNDLIGGTIKVAIDTLPQNVPFAKAGKLRMLAVTSPRRAALAPDVPSVTELGMPELVAENFFGVSAPAGLPRPIAERMHAAVMAALDDPKVRRTFEEAGIDTRRMSIDAFSAFVGKQVSDWEPSVKASGARLN